MQDIGNEAELGSAVGPRRTRSEILDAIPHDVGPRIATSSGAVFHAIRPPGVQDFLSPHHFAGVLLAPTPRIKVRLGEDSLREFDGATGQIIINPADIESSWEWSATLELAIFALTRERLDAIAQQESGCDSGELIPPPFGTIDSTALTIAQLLKADLVRSESELYADTLITLFGIHLLHNYTRHSRPPRSARGGLGRDAAQRVRDYLNENFTQQLTVNELAGIAGLSPKYFIKAFTRTFGAAPHRYLRDLRLDFAERLLVGGNLTIAEVAYLSGFSSQSHLTAKMKKYRRNTPMQLRPKA